MESYNIVYSSSHSTAFLSGFQRLRSEGKMCDVVLVAGGISFPCHRALLASASEYFWALFGETTAERLAGSISLPLLTSQGLDAILDFLYSGWLSVSPHTVAAVLEAARYLQVEKAVSICERFMMNGLRTENCCYYANLAELHGVPDTLKAANQTTALEMRTLLQEHKDDLLALNFQSLIAVLDANEIPGVTEVELLKLALDWLDENGPLPLLKSNLLLIRLRFGLIHSSELAQVNHKAMATPLIRSHVTQALEYHRMGSAQPIRQSRQTTLRTSPDYVLLVGGRSSTDSTEQCLQSFDPRSKKVSCLSSSLPVQLKNHCVCSVGGFLFVIGGEGLKEGDRDGIKSSMFTYNHLWRYDPRFECWEQMESMLQRRAQFSCCVVDNVIYVIGGRFQKLDTDLEYALHTVEFYDMTVGSWKRGANMRQTLYGHASTVLDNGIYVSGGLSNIQDNPGDNFGENTLPTCSREVLFWDLKDRGWKKRAPMSIARFGHRLATVHGYIYALLGIFESFCDIERYDSQSNQWTRLRPFTTGSFNYGMVSMPSGNLLLFGGQRWTAGRLEIMRSVIEYDTIKDRWREICKLPSPLTGTECTLLPLLD